MKPKKNWTIRKAVKSDLIGTKALADAHKSELGFVLRPILEQAIQKAEIFVAVNEAKLLGFVHFHHRRDEQTTLYNMVVHPEYRRRGIGEQLLESLLIESRTKEKDFILLKCPENLSANEFYRRTGFSKTRIEAGKMRRLVVWKKEV